MDTWPASLSTQFFFLRKSPEWERGCSDLFHFFFREIHIHPARRPRKMKRIHLLIYFSFTHPLLLIQAVNKSPTVRSMLKTWMRVPQGTILGPFLFLIYINDLPNCLTSCQTRMYADDTHITYTDVDVNSIQSNLNHDIGILNKWLFFQQTYFGHC